MGKMPLNNFFSSLLCEKWNLYCVGDDDDDVPPHSLDGVVDYVHITEYDSHNYSVQPIKMHKYVKTNKKLAWV